MDERKLPARPTVVLVDDDPEILRSLGRALRHEPYELLVTNSPRRVLDWAGRRPLDLVMTDQRMPEICGTELLRALRECSPATRGVILSGFPDTALIVERSGLRIERLIAKPWDNADLLTTIRSLLTTSGPEAAIDIVINCAGLEAGLVLAEIISACRRAPAGTSRARIHLDNVLQLNDSLARLLKDLARAAVWLDLSLEIRDASGCVNAFLEAVGECPRIA